MSKYTKTRRAPAHPRVIRVIDLRLEDALWSYNGDGTWVLEWTRLTRALDDVANALDEMNKED